MQIVRSYTSVLLALATGRFVHVNESSQNKILVNGNDYFDIFWTTDFTKVVAKRALFQTDYFHNS